MMEEEKEDYRIRQLFWVTLDINAIKKQNGRYLTLMMNDVWNAINKDYIPEVIRESNYVNVTIANKLIKHLINNNFRDGAIITVIDLTKFT